MACHTLCCEAAIERAPATGHLNFGMVSSQLDIVNESGCRTGRRDDIRDQSLAHAQGRARTVPTHSGGVPQYIL